DETREHAVIWRGSQTEFVSGEPNVVLERGAGGPGTTAMASPTPVDSETPATGDDPFPTTTALALVVLVVLVGGGALYLRSRG
ncbi:hypothetical protein HKX41_12695, partial [Salinisphaera sp. USBA-960]|nr:hypothetical protein [Salifodinibacter halophilus]